VCSNDGVDRIGRVLALDYGEKNIGLAYCDELGLTVRPLPSIPNHGQRDLLKRLQALVRAMSIQKLVVGIPLNMDGSRGDSATRMEPFMGVLRRALQIPLAEADERLSTVEAMEYWRKMSPRQQKRYRTVDSLAAALILERYLKEG
jgi:putative Holliday junction resolvase